MIAESHLASGVARHVHAAEEEAPVVGGGGGGGGGRRDAGGDGSAAQRRPVHLGLHRLVVLFVDDVVHAVAVDQQVLLFFFVFF